MQNIDEIRKYIESEINSIEGIVCERARRYLGDSIIDDNEIIMDYNVLNLDMDEYPVTDYDFEDYANQNFDIGALYQLKNILKLLQ
jgi:hypothetical protein